MDVRALCKSISYCRFVRPSVLHVVLSMWGGRVESHRSALSFLVTLMSLSKVTSFFVAWSLVVVVASLSRVSSS